jgi:hypothetical protein
MPSSKTRLEVLDACVEQCDLIEQFFLCVRPRRADAR